MKMSIHLFIAFSLVYSAYGNLFTYVPNNNGILLRNEQQQQQIDYYGNTKRLIEELVVGLRSAAGQAIFAVGNFTTGIQEQVILFKDKLIHDVNQLSERIEEAIRDLNSRLQDASEAVSECVTTHQVKAEALFGETVNQTTLCVDRRIEELSVLITELNERATLAMAEAEAVIQELHSCTHEGSTSVLTTGSCLGNVLVKAEVKAAVFAGQSGILIARINFGLATLPAALQVCAGARLFEATVKTSQLVISVSRCSISSTINTIYGK